MIEAKPQNLIGDRAYDSDPLDERLRRRSIEMIAPHRSNRSKPPTQDGRRFRRYARRWLVERFFAAPPTRFRYGASLSAGNGLQSCPGTSATDPHQSSRL
jgi:hypothetical protein